MNTLIKNVLIATKGKTENKQGAYMHLVYSKHGKFAGIISVSYLKGQKMLFQYAEYSPEEM